MTDKPTLKLDWCSYEAAKYAVEHWHYSGTMPSPYSKPVKIGVWENEKFIGVIIFSTGVSSNLGKPYGLNNSEVSELQRIALSNHKTQVSRMIIIAIKMIKRANPGLRMLISFADPYQNHHGGIYQACGWLFTGKSDSGVMYFDKSGRKRHPRNVRNIGGYDKFGVKVYGKDDIDHIEERPGKYRYLFPLDDAMRKQVEPLRKPYPKRGLGEIDNAPQSNEETGGASPTSPLLESNCNTVK